MLPGPNELSQKDSTQSEASETSPSRNHGLYHQEQSTPLEPRAGSGDGVSREPLQRSGSQKSLDSLGSPLQGLSHTNTSTGSRSPVDRISEHENALKRSYRRKGRKGPSFTVVHRPARASSDVHITSFPNEVLTHILSHLPPNSLSSMALVSKQFHQLVTTPHAWRSAFSRYFPGSESLGAHDGGSEGSSSDAIASDRRVFTRLSTLSSWRNEYILRCRLLRSLARGRPADTMKVASSTSSRSNAGQSAQITFSSGLACPVSHIQGSFGADSRNGHVKFIHGAEELGMASISDSKIGKLEKWGFQDNASFRQFQEIAPGETQHGLGAGDAVGVPNSMDVSQLFGLVYGEGIENDSVLWFRHAEEKRGRALLRSSGLRDLEHGLPQLPEEEAICSVWIAKNRNIPDLSNGSIGIIAGSSNGIVTAYSPGTNHAFGRRYERGEITFRWVVSPGVPIISIVMDEDLSQQRLRHGRIWALVLNALGEVYYLTDLPSWSEEGSPSVPIALPHSPQILERKAWVAGRSVHWKMIESTRREAHVDPFEKSEVDGSYSPTLSPREMLLSRDQMIAETKEVESFLRKKPKHFRAVCYGWDMNRQLEADFAATDKSVAGEVVLVLASRSEKVATPDIKRYTRHRIDDRTPKGSAYVWPAAANDTVSRNDRENQTADSVFGGASPVVAPSWSFAQLGNEPDHPTSMHHDQPSRPLIEEWRTSRLSFSGVRASRITARALDKSIVAVLAAFEDPQETMMNISNASSPTSSPIPETASPSPRDVPGQKARLIALGTDNGAIILFNIRSAGPVSSILERFIHPVRIIHTDSPQISCLGLTALYLVHGGNDGLVQAWDPLASTVEPTRTLNSRFSSRARRRLVQAAASPAGVGINLFAASAIALDPDPIQLRGIVSLGSHLRFWSYSSDGVESFKGSKRRLRRSERGSNQGADRFTNTGRGALRDYIANEKLDLEREKRDKRKENDRLAGRFGIGLLGPGASEDEIMAYATMLSEEAAEDDLRRRSESSGSEQASASVVTSPELQPDDELAEALERSLADSSDTTNAFPEYSVRTKGKGRQSASEYDFATSSTASSFASPAIEDDDLEFAMQLSRVEHESRAAE